MAHCRKPFGGAPPLTPADFSAGFVVWALSEGGDAG